MLLANLQDDVQLLLCDPDEYLALDAPASLADTFDDCLQVNLDDCLKVLPTSTCASRVKRIFCCISRLHY